LKSAKEKCMQIVVRDNNIDQVLKVLRTAFEKPSERRTREKAEAVRRARKTERKRLQREGLIAAPKKKERVLNPRMPRTDAPIGL
jgi:small subunit ribosomal protein S21